MFFYFFLFIWVYSATRRDDAIAMDYGILCECGRVHDRSIDMQRWHSITFGIEQMAQRDVEKILSPLYSKPTS